MCPNKAIVMFCSVLRHLNFQKHTSQQGEKTNDKKKQHQNLSRYMYFETVFNNQNVSNEW
jgi:hypothetical protein